MEGALREAELQDQGEARGEARGEAELLLPTGKHVPLASDQLHPRVERRAKVGGKGRERNERSYKKSKNRPGHAQPWPRTQELCVPPALPAPISLQRPCFWGGVQCSPNYSNQVMEGFVNVERWVLGTGFYVRNLEGKAHFW